MPWQGSGISYSAARLWVEKEMFLITRAEFDKGEQKPLKVMALSEVKEFRSDKDPKKSYKMPTHIEMVNKKTGGKTLVELLDLKFDTELSDNFFTVAQLKRECK